MDKHTARDLDRQWEDMKTRQEKVSLGQISQKLISLYELGKLWLSLKDGDNCIVLHRNGSIYRGNSQHIKLDKMTKLQECYKTEEHSDLLRVESDMKSAEEMYPIAFNGARAAKWDTRTRLANGTAPKKGKGRVAEPVVAADDI